MARVLTHDPDLGCPNPDITMPDDFHLGPDEIVTCGVCQEPLVIVDSDDGDTADNSLPEVPA